MAKALSLDHRELLVWGYMREIEKVHKNLNIPFEINEIIYLYQRLYDEWSEKYKSEHISIDANKSMVTINTNNAITIYGKEVVKEGIFKWKVKIISFTYNDFGSYPHIGIVQDNENDLNNYLGNTDFDDFGYLLCGKSGDLWALSDKKYTPYTHNIWRNNDTILEMRLDLVDGTLSFKTDDEEFDELSININVSQKGYRLALGVCNCEDSQFQIIM